MARKTSETLSHALVLSVRAGRDQRAGAELPPETDRQRRVFFALLDGLVAAMDSVDYRSVVLGKATCVPSENIITLSRFDCLKAYEHLL
jgi:hypothetical protein